MSVISGPENHKPKASDRALFSLSAFCILAGSVVGIASCADNNLRPQSTLEETYAPSAEPGIATKAAKLLCADALNENRPQNDHIVEKGDNLSQIAADTMRGTDQAVEKMMAANGMDEAAADNIQIGQRIRIPQPDCVL